MTDTLTRAGRIPPHSEEAEQALIGSLLLQAGRVSDLCATRGITAESFYAPAHRVVLEAVSSMLAKEIVVDLVSVCQWLKDHGEIEAAGGDAYIEHLIDRTPTDAHAEYYIDVVRDKHSLRKIIETCREAAAHCYEEQRDVADIISSAHEKLMAAQDSHTKSSSLSGHATNLLADYDRLRRSDTAGIIRSPYPQYGKLIGPYEKGVHICAARQKVGKSSWCFGELLMMAEQFPVAAINLELKNELILDRWAASASNVSTWILRNLDDQRDLISDEEYEELRKQVQRISKLPIYFAPQDLTPGQAFAWLRWAIRKHGVRYAVLDRADKLKADKRYNTRFDKAADYCERITEFANSTIPLRTVVHLNRRVEIDNARAKADEERWPTSADLRDTGTWEQDAYSITLLHRLGGKEAKTSLVQKIACIVDDNRNGPTGVINFIFDRALHRWAEEPPKPKHELPSD